MLFLLLDEFLPILLAKIHYTEIGVETMPNLEMKVFKYDKVHDSGDEVCSGAPKLSRWQKSNFFTPKC